VPSSSYIDTPVLLCNCTAIRQAARHMTRFYDASLAEVGLRGTQYIVLLFLSRCGPVTMADLAEALVMDRTTIGHNLKPLERDGFINLNVGQEDRRSRIISLTDAGLSKVEEGGAAWTKAQDEFEEKFGTVKARDMREMMGQVVQTELGANSSPA
jgi:DNA-binding MarR family transcriptional regulator